MQHGLAGWGKITIAKDEYIKINDHTRLVNVTNKISSMTATRTFTVMYAIEVCHTLFYYVFYDSVEIDVSVYQFCVLVTIYSSFMHLSMLC